MDVAAQLRNRAEPLEQRRRLLLVVDLLDEEDARDPAGPLVDSDRILPLQQRIDVLFECEPEDALDLAELRLEAWDLLPTSRRIVRNGASR